MSVTGVLPDGLHLPVGVVLGLTGHPKPCGTHQMPNREALMFKVGVQKVSSYNKQDVKYRWEKQWKLKYSSYSLVEVDPSD